MFVFLRISQNTVTNYKPILAFPFAQSPPAALADGSHSSVSTRLRHLTRSVPRSALRAEPPENEFAFPKNPLTEGTRGRPGHVVPLNVLNIAAAVADEM